MKEYKMKINGNEYVVVIDIQDEQKAQVVVNGATYSVELEDAKVKKAVPTRPQVAAAPASHPVRNSATPAAAPVAAGGGAPVNSPLPGVILDIRVAVGDSVSAGQTLAVLEAMKMENNVDAPMAGVVKSIAVRCGDSVLEGDVLITIG
ncbi:MAG: biotin/lipoyl-containing protein [Rikenellaceae bacterium]